MIMDVQNLIKDINLSFKKLSILSHDELRQKFFELREQLEVSDAPIDGLLVDVFAIAKDTMRRFAENEKIEVQATAKEKEIAEEYDYLKVEDDKANYSNKWKAGGEPFVWNMIPYDEQLQGGIELHQGKIIQMATGEGKTIVAVAPAILNALTGNKVHIMTVNNYLSRRDFEITRPIYSFLGLTAGCVEGFERYSWVRKMAYSCDITFGSSSDFIFDYLFDHIAASADKCVQREHGFCIVDEADSVLIDEAQTPHVIGSGDLPENGEENMYVKYLSLVQSLVDSNDGSDYYTVDSLRQSVSLTDCGKQWLAEQVGDSLLFDTGYHEKEVKEIEGNKNFSERQRKGFIEAANNRHYDRIHLRNVLSQLLRALTVYVKDRDYIVENNEIIIIDDNTGRPKYGHVWQYGLHEAVMAKENVKSTIGNNFIHATISTKNYVSLYRKISGMTGTAISAKDEFKELYGLDVAFVPSHRPNIREDRCHRIFKTVPDKESAILAEVKSLHSQHRPILIGVSSISESEKIGKLLKDAGYDIRLLNALTLSDEANIISQAGMADSITVATSVAGRGTDIKPSQDSLSNGGLAVIGVNLASSKRIDEQLIGRSGRQGDPGSSQFFVSVEDKIIGYLPDDDKKELVALLKSETDVEIQPASAKDFFAKAQSIKEEEDRKQRVGVAEQDDVIDSHRRLIYDTRMSLLKKGSDVDVIGKLFPSYNEPSFQSQCQSVNENIIADSLPIIGHAIINIHSIDKASLIPLLYNNEIFTVKCNFENALITKGEDIIKVIHSQIVLRLIDKYWITFINKINTNLISASEYEQIFQKIYKEMEEELKDALLNLRVAIWNRRSSDEVMSLKKEKLVSATNMDILGPLDLCPCGSGKQYCLCHGSMK